MEPSQARQQLLAEHDELRTILARADRIAREVVAGAAVTAELRDVLQLCRDLFAIHNASEERLLGPILQQDFAWGQVRIDRMFEEHRAEHAEIFAALRGPVREVAGRIGDLRELVEAHMAAEERTFLSRGVLRDDVVTVEGGS
jgi:hypothetical protein